MAATAVQKRVLVDTVIQPASPFAELLRRSRFAAYDPKINRTYSAPPAYAQRGNWGLKRPINHRRKNSYITLRAYEEHAQYIHWTNAERAVRFVKQTEELNITPKVSQTSNWAKNLGPGGTFLWVTDSEFAPAPDSVYKHDVVQSTSETASSEDMVLGKGGPGAYGETRSHLQTRLIKNHNTKVWDYRQPIPAAMNARQFERYLEELRRLRPAFYKELRAGIATAETEETSNASMLAGDMTNMEIGVVNSVSEDHHQFLNHYFEKTWATRDEQTAAPDPVTGEAQPKDFVTKKIKPQPHRFGGLTYSHPSILETYYTTSPKPAHVLTDSHSDFSAPKTGQFTGSRVDGTKISFAGLLASSDSRLPSAKPLFTPGSGPQADAVNRSVVTVRASELELIEPPRVVGLNPQGPERAQVLEHVFECPPHQERRTFDNTHVPGSFEYASANPQVTVSTYGTSPGSFKRSANAQARPGSTRSVMSRLGSLVASTRK
ncbi:hypothetical protein FA15DRAFT_663641 [Coprinopsis marcescibilis]|uniref:Uncharacterized protein n=1 Tax=Coprinopsis marcescibilis TaxID=230819 RepID=A0A5C3LCT8_COPMA|nr:hypothetical protein FA15DRAFT_663641 [Coprinopsis marcescibilis]